MSAENQDLFRAPLGAIEVKALVQALLWLHGKVQHPPCPTSIHLDLTLRCTARCIHCKQWAWPAHSEFTVDQLNRLFDVFRSWKVKTVTLGGGNPLLHDNVALAIQMAHSAGIQVGIVSEGAEMTDELADVICKHARWIRFSLDGPSPDIHDRIRNAPGAFDQVIKCIRKLRSHQSRVHIGLNCVVQKSNLKNLSLMIDLAESIGVDTLLFKVPHGDDRSNRFLLSSEEWDWFVKWVQKAIPGRDIGVRTNLSQLGGLLGGVFCKEDAIRGKPVHSFHVRERIRCFVPLFFLACDSEGNMYPCDYLQADTRLWNGNYGLMRNEFNLGNLLADSQQVLQNLARMLRERVHNLPASGYDECGSCTRFCQLNAVLSRVYDELAPESITEQTLATYLSRCAPKQSEYCFL
jgi:MoaA/NifB/PqqE/SkfB family radical SAM enzyme